ncbi:class I SAM-dependent methyltransferase [Aggregicoccus sp. 17bor-14]|uniref:class I SAM-dependent methyltransferase n=1 Tax=Myxococcaceae TaxID=31 RepID=UPI00129C8AFF|nr:MULTISPECIES: class I SAM-dependent methyltransferase [Myxococcaceae]MBF5045400.1 methyltransferase domain-containing protein [Simulacricoccus sp. 17bor-14]MRI91141.1 class I SAM-dependent methyltransferase [Aggregicoccus sp. 17bor-14]
MSLDALFLLHSGLAREAPGSDACTFEALRRLGPLPASPRVLDLGCGPGASTLALARALQVPVTGMDLHAPYLQQLRTRAEAEGLAELVRTREADFGALDDEPESVDLLWSEGAINHLTWAQGLRRWRPLVAPGGALALSELTWLTHAPPAEARAFWRRAYPNMGTVDFNCAVAQAFGLRVQDTFVLPPEAWEAYYRPLEARMERLERQVHGDAELTGLIAETRQEVALYRQCGESYGYVFYLLRV